MADKVLGGPLAVDFLGLANGWIAQDSGLNENNQRATGLGANGDESVSKLYDGKSDVSINLENQNPTGTLYVPPLGLIASGYAIVGWTLTFDAQGWPKLVPQVHQHSSNPHTVLTQYACPVLNIPAGYGIPILATPDGGYSTASRLAASITMSCTHNDELDGDGEHSAGENRNGQCAMTLSFGGQVDLTTFITSGGWDRLSKDGKTSNKSFNGTDFNLVKKVYRT